MIQTTQSRLVSVFIRPITRACCFALLILSINAGAAQAEPGDQKELEDENAGVEQTLLNWHGYLSQKVESLGEAVDKVFDSDISFQEINQTSVRLRMDLDAVDGEDIEFNPKLDIKWVLPAADNKWSLLIRSEDTFDTSDGSLGEPLLGDDDQGMAALDFAIRDNEKIRTSLAAGVKSDQSYLRLNFRRRFGLGQHVKSRIRNRLSYFTRDGWNNDFRFDIDVPFGKPLPDTREFVMLSTGADRSPWLFRSASQVRWYENSESDLFEQRFSFFTRSSSRSVLAYEGGARGCSNPNATDGSLDCRGYDLRMRYRVSPKYNWLSFLIMPVADFPEWNNYDLNAQIRLQMEIWFGRGERAQRMGARRL